MLSGMSDSSLRTGHFDPDAFVCFVAISVCTCVRIESTRCSGCDSPVHGSRS